jgi:hypothetical protein
MYAGLVFLKLGLPPTDRQRRQVLAVLTALDKVDVGSGVHQDSTSPPEVVARCGSGAAVLSVRGR